MDTDMIDAKEDALEEQNLEQAEIPEPPPKPLIKITVSDNRIRAYMELSRTASETSDPERADIESALAEKGIVYGINENLISVICEKPKYNIPVEIAKGKPEATGKDGYIEYFIETKKDIRPKIRQDGTTDYRDMGLVHNVEKGQSLCKVHPAEKGSDGQDVYGNIIEGAFGKDSAPPVGRNTEYDEENRIVIAVTDGDAEVDSKGIINVCDVLKLQSVDNSTGDIDFNGDVVVSGDVASDFKINSKGNITVKGTVEGATLIAKGDIVIGAGINGMDRAKLISGGSIKCKYIQNCNIQTGVNIYADSIMHCTIECNGDIELSGKHGALLGGKSVVANALIAKTIGTSAHVPTQVTMVGGSLERNRRLLETKKIVAALDSELITTVQTLSWCDNLIKNGKQLKPLQKNAYEHALTRLGPIQTERKEKIEQLSAIENELGAINPENCYIKCGGRIHSGVKITFGTQIMQVNASFTNSRVSLLDGQINISAQ